MIFKKHQQFKYECILLKCSRKTSDCGHFVHIQNTMWQIKLPAITYNLHILLKTFKLDILHLKIRVHLGLEDNYTKGNFR